jgi:hypothetical protein
MQRSVLTTLTDHVVYVTIKRCHGCTVFTPVHSVDMADVSKSNIAERNDVVHDLENVPHMNHAQHKRGKYAVNVVGEGCVHVSTEDVR